LGAARIAPQAAVKPARGIEGVEVVAIAARDRGRAERFARKHGVARVHDSYAALLDDPDVDAVYNPLPNGLHGYWTLAAIAAGKHVLCEKPFTANADEARVVADAAAASDRVVMEAFHYRHHPLAERMRELARDGSLGAISTVDTRMCIPLPMPNDIRYKWDLAGGATMDVGCYAIHMNRLLAGGEPEVVTADATTFRDPRIDRVMRAELRYPNGVAGTMTCSLFSARLLSMGVRVVGERGVLKVLNPTVPQYFHRLRLEIDGKKSTERIKTDPTYTHQLRAFVAAVVDGGPMLTTPADAVVNMSVIDAVYEAAGLPKREPTPVP
jgi:predicted dehydrogenase